MMKIDIDQLRYRRQYLISPRPVSCNFMHTTHSLTGDIRLYAHIDLNVNTMQSAEVKLVLLGDMFDYEYVQKDNEELLRDIIHTDFKVVLERISKYTGRFVLVFIKAGELFLVTDATASRKVFYCRRAEGVYCASQPHLLAATLHLEISHDQSKLAFYSSDEFRRLNNANIGNTTCYDDVFQLTANHYLDYSHCKFTRFWPNQKSSILPLDHVVNTSAAIIKGYISSIGHRYKLMLPVTGGKDSRLLLSATADIRDQVFYYINKDPKVGVKAYDVEIPKTLLPKLGLDFHVLVPDQHVDPDFRKVYFENNPYANEAFLPIIYNYHVNFGDRVNLPGTFVNVVEDVYEVFHQKITPYVLAELIHIERFDYAEQYFAEWLKGCSELCGQLNFNVLNLLYWEERVANWGTQLQLDKDIAQDDIIPYNSRLLIQTMLSAELKYREKPDFQIFAEITQKLWPETLQAPCNPDFKMDVLKISKKLGLMHILKNLYYKYIH